MNAFLDIFTYIYHKSMVNVGKHSSPMRGSYGVVFLNQRWFQRYSDVFLWRLVNLSSMFPWTAWHIFTIDLSKVGLYLVVCAIDPDSLGNSELSTDVECNIQYQLSVNWWFGLVVWKLGFPLRVCYLEVPLESQTTNPNHQFTIGRSREKIFPWLTWTSRA